MSRKQIKITSFAALLIILLVLYMTGGMTTILHMDQDKIGELTHNNSALILLIMLVIMVLQNLFTFIPLILVISVNMSLFGFVNGYLYSWICSVIGSTLIFFATRYWFQAWLTKNLNRKYLDKIEKNGFLFVLLGRIFPFVPTNLINITAGISVVKAKHFIMGTALGNLIYSLVLSSVVYGVLSVASEYMNYILIGVVVVLVNIFLYKRRKNLRIN